MYKNRQRPVKNVSVKLGFFEKSVSKIIVIIIARDHKC